MIRLRHVGIVVRNVEESKKFYQDLFNLEIQKELIEDGKYIEQLVGIQKASIKWVKLKAQDGTIFELLEYQHQKVLPIDNYSSNRLGCSHIAITVQNIDDTYKKLQSYNCHCKSAPLSSPDGKVKVMYAHDINGTILEIVEEL